MKKIGDDPNSWWSRVIRAVAALPEARLAPGVGFDGVRTKNLAIATHGRAGVEMHAVQFSRIAATAAAAGL